MKLIILLVPSILSMKVLRTTKYSDSTSRVELLNSDIQHADSWTICGRFRNPFIPGLKKGQEFYNSANQQQPSLDCCLTV